MTSGGDVTGDVRVQMIALLPRLRRFAIGLTGNGDEADDLVQAACERALSRLDQYRPGTRLDSWMYRIVQTTFIDGTRRKKVRGEQIDLDDAGELPGADGPRAIEARLTLESVREAIGRLPEEQRSVLLLVTVEGLSYEEAAESLGIPKGTVMSRLARARLKLHDMVHGPEPAPDGSLREGSE